MQYFTKPLWIDAQNPGDAALANGRQYEQAFVAYAQQLEALRDRLPADVFAFFRNADVHDGALMHLRIRDFDLAPEPALPVDATDAEQEGEDGPWEGPYRVTVELAVVEWTKSQWTLRYAGLRRILVDFPTESPLFYSPGNGFEDWGYHELTDAGDGFLRHEVLFSSGAIVLLEFRDVVVERVPSRPTAT